MRLSQPELEQIHRDLTDAPLTGRVHADAGLRVGLLSRIGRSDLAAFLVDEVTQVRHLLQRVYVST